MAGGQLPARGDLVNASHWANFTSNRSITNTSASDCQQDSIMGSILQNASPYLYPFIVEYSLIAAAFLYIMWSTIGKRYSMVYEENCLSSVSCHQVPVDSLSTSSRTSSYQNLPALYSCLGSSKGLLSFNLASHLCASLGTDITVAATSPVLLLCTF